MSPVYEWLAICFGVSGCLLGVCMLASLYKDSSWPQRYAIGFMALLNFTVALDGLTTLRTFVFSFSPSPIGVGFAAALSIYWAYALLHKRST